MTKAEASRKNAKNAAYVTNRIRALKKEGYSHDEAKEVAKKELKAKKVYFKDIIITPLGIGKTIIVKRERS